MRKLWIAVPKSSTKAAYFQTLDVDVPMLRLVYVRCSCMLCSKTDRSQFEFDEVLEGAALFRASIQFKNLSTFGAGMVA